MGRKPTFTAGQDEWILGQAAAGRTNAEIGAGIGRTAEAIKGRLAYLHASRAALAEQDARIRELFDAGLPYEAIAAEVGATKGRVLGRCRSMGLQRTLEDGHRMRGAMAEYKAAHARPRTCAPWHALGDGPLTRRFNEQQDRIWAEGGPKPVRYKDGFFDETAVW